MPFLIDGNNLLYAMIGAGREVGRAGLCAILAELVRRGQRVTVIFDGPAPADPLAGQIAAGGVEVAYAAPDKADDLICRRIAANTAPRRLTVVSTDRQIRQAAQRRRCKSVRSEEFAETLVKMADTPPAPAPAEPPEKRTGLTKDQTSEWLKEFGLDAEA